MINHIRSLLEECGISVYRINEKHTETAELYFIKQKLDMPRKKVLDETSIEIFRDIEKDGKKLRASTNVLLSPSMSDDEITSAIKDAYFAAQFAANPFFELPKPEVCEHMPSSSDLAKKSTDEVAKIIADSVFSVDTAKDAFVNSLEIFVTKTTTHIVGSTGLDVCFDSCFAEGEFVVQCITPKDVEQYRSFKYDTLNTEGLKQKVIDSINDVRARARSSQPPKSGKYTVVLKGDHIRTILDYYLSRSSAGMIYPGYSDWKVGTRIQKEITEGEKLHLTLESSVPYSSEGIRMKRRELINDGVLALVHGNARFCYYLNTEPTGNYEKIVSDNGTVPYADMIGEGVLEPISFSDFQMDTFDGHFKGEIRLALLHHADGSVEELSGGSINGSLPDSQNNLIFSKERYEDDTYNGPMAIKIENVAVAGI